MSVSHQILYDAVEAQKASLLEAERWLWEHPASGYREWPAHR